MSNNTNSKMVVPGAKQAIDKMKYEIANEQDQIQLQELMDQLVEKLLKDQ